MICELCGRGLVTEKSCVQNGATHRYWHCCTCGEDYTNSEQVQQWEKDNDINYGPAVIKSHNRKLEVNNEKNNDNSNTMLYCDVQSS